MGSLDAGDLVVKRSPPSMGGMDIYRKGARYHENSGDLQKVTFFNELGMRGLGHWIGKQLSEEKRSCAARSSKKKKRRQARKSAAFELGRGLVKDSGLQDMLSHPAARSGLVGAGVGMLGGGAVGAVTGPEGKRKRLLHVLKRMLQGGAIGGAVGGAYGAGRAADGDDQAQFLAELTNRLQGQK
jgi:hypothetical protein